ncbi:MAG: hypothetical protein A3B37_01770 [Candidatus Sungbacteria bacterium RIFCSPLOWO2_01_FULL_59_16]|uniref:Uncharacterized protein n=1 Tax=Candidatus Sungbacteria bacterium RIFCSPLOWO2_01_FULL_59_16 TaxID=1802280 RepID=A0A1G2LAC5_9BACT|nr:MAG: hypothetical protein A3B37_01770 [Candidatus Sungbacteria bacterium RIFCSPLOWO2_01_FULL_59_16]
MQTIFITIFQAVEAKNILRTNVIRRLLQEPDVRVVCLTRSAERAEHYRREIAHERLSYEVYAGAPSGFWERVFSFLKFHLIRTATTDLKRRMYRGRGASGIAYWLGLAVNRILAWRSVRCLARFFDSRLVHEPGAAALLKAHRPDAVFAAHLFDDAEIAILREAKRFRIPTVGFINSWDKLTARSALRLLPERLVVFNAIVKREAVMYADMPEERITVSGIPQYDQYVTDKPVAREEFCRAHGLDPSRPVILFAPMGRAFSDSDWDVIDLLHKITGAGFLVTPVELFVRFQPNDFFEEREISKRPWLKYAYPGTRFGTARGGDWDMSFEELSNLTATLAHCALLVCYASSMSVDAAHFDRPVININFELKPSSSPAKSPTQYYATEHYRNVLTTGGVKLVESPEELVQWINRYLADPSLDREGRERLVREQCGVTDGRAGERIAKAILVAIKTKSPRA